MWDVITTCKLDNDRRREVLTVTTVRANDGELCRGSDL